jgi:hypothetical protein
MMVRRAVSLLVSVSMVGFLLVGCGSKETMPAAQPSQPSSAQSKEASPQPAKQEPTKDSGTSGDQRPSPPKISVKLVPLETKHELQFKMVYPDGGQVMVTALNDLVEIVSSPVRISIKTRQLKGEAAPGSAAEMKRSVESWAPEAVVTKLTKPGTSVAYELAYIQGTDGSQKQVLAIVMYGSTYKQELSFSVPAANYAQWEAHFRRMIESFEPSNLNAVPLPNRP